MKNSTKAVAVAGALGAGAVLVYLATRPQPLGLASARAKEEEMLNRVFPLGVGTLSDTKTFTITAATAFGICWTARVKDLATGWQFDGNLATMLWTPSAPIVRPGAGNLYIRFEARNISLSGNLTLTIKDDTGATLKTETLVAGNIGSGTEYVSIEWTGEMPTRNYGITVSVTP